MFKRYIYIPICLCMLLIAGWSRMFYAPSTRGIEAYRSLLAFTDGGKQDAGEAGSRTKQSRLHVSKQILYVKEGRRLESRLMSDRSELVLNRNGCKPEPIEYFENARCFIEEKLPESEISSDSIEGSVSDPGFSLRSVRSISAQNAAYFYLTGELQAEEVQLSRYILSDRYSMFSLSEGTILFHGNANRIRFSLFNGPNFKATGLQTTFNRGTFGW